MDASPESLAGSQDQCKTHRYPGRGRQAVAGQGVGWGGGGMGDGEMGSGGVAEVVVILMCEMSPSEGSNHGDDGAGGAS